MSAQPTPRTDPVTSRPWRVRPDGLIARFGEPDSGYAIGYTSFRADAQRICDAVNDYDRLLAVEAAARARETAEERLADFESRPVDSDFDTHEAWFAEHGHRLHNRAEAVAVLRVALARPAEEERG